MTDEERDLLEDDNGDSDSEQSTNDAPDSDGADTDESDNSTERIDALMSKWQKAEARAKKAEAALARQNGDGAKESNDRPSIGDDPEVQSLKAFLLDTARKTVYESDPRLEQYGVEIDALEGSSPEEIRKSFTRQLKLIDQMEARIQDSLLAEHGLIPETRGGAPDPVDVAKMSSEEFDKYIEDSLAGRR